MARSKSTQKREEVSKEPVIETPVKEEGVKVTYLGKGGLDGEYLFAEFAGSIAARSLEEAIEKAKELLTKHPSLRVQ